MISSLVFENNKMSELLIKMYFINAKYNMCSSFCEIVELSEMYNLTRDIEPNCVVIQYELYCENIYDIISNIRQIAPNCKVIIVSNKMKNKVKKKLFLNGVNYVFTKPFVDTDFFRAIIH